MIKALKPPNHGPNKSWFFGRDTGTTFSDPYKVELGRNPKKMRLSDQEIMLVNIPGAPNPRNSKTVGTNKSSP